MKEITAIVRMKKTGATKKTLIEAGVVKGKRLTSWPSLQTDLRNAGAEWVDEPMVRDGNLVTSRKPDDLPQFDPAMIELFAQAVPVSR